MGSFAPWEGVSPTVLTVPGLGGSGPSHWQTLWEQARPDTVRVELGMWNTPHRNAWVTRLDEAIRRAEAPVVLATHSLGCLAVAWWAQLSPQPYGWPVAGTLLVAPADARKNALGLREIRLWVPDTRAPGFKEEARRQAALLDHSEDEREAADMMTRFAAEAWDRDD